MTRHLQVKVDSDISIVSTAWLNPILSVVFKPLVSSNFHACLDKTRQDKTKVFTQFMNTFLFPKTIIFNKARWRCRFCNILSSLGSKVSVYLSAKKRQKFNSLSSPWLHPGLIITSHTSLVTNHTPLVTYHTPLVTNHQKTQLGWRPHLPTAVERLLCVQGC